MKKIVLVLLAMAMLIAVPCLGFDGYDGDHAGQIPLCRNNKTGVIRFAPTKDVDTTSGVNYEPHCNTRLFWGTTIPIEEMIWINIQGPRHDAIGSWFGRAVPVSGQTICSPGEPGCPVPEEIVMVFTVNADGTFIATDSAFFFVGGTHTTAHGQWVQDSTSSIKAEFTLLQSMPTGVFIGGFKDLFSATVVGPDEMQGIIDKILYNYVSPSGGVIVDTDGFPMPNPLDPSAACSTTPGCTDLGQFSFIVRRVKVH